jgi:hypothetical protein
METPINLEETPGKTVGKRKIVDAFAFGMELQRAGNTMRRSNGLPKGVYKFHSHEEADQWILDQLTKRKNTTLKP